MSRKRPDRLSNTPVPRRFCQAHFPVRGAEKAHRCHHCHKNKGERHETVWHCDECGVFLCHNGRDNNRFREFHIKYGPSCDMYSNLHIILIYHLKCYPLSFIHASFTFYSRLFLSRSLTHTLSPQTPHRTHKYMCTTCIL